MMEWKREKEKAGLFQDGKKIFEAEAVCQEGVRLSFSVHAQGSAAAVGVSAVMERKQPLFGAQPFFDRKEGVRFTLKGMEADGMLCVYQHKDWWIRPAFPGRWEDVPARTQLLVWEKEGQYAALMAVCGPQCRADMQGGQDGICVTVASNQDGCAALDGLSLAVSCGPDPYRCCEEAAEYALKLLGHPEMSRKARSYPEIFEYFGWCSWDAFYHKVNEKGLLEKIQELKEKDIPARWVLIDDGWLDADYEKQVLKGLDADREKFPDGLAGCVEKLKKDYGIRHVGVWHAVMGYWNGLEKGSEAEKALQEGCRELADGRVIPAAETGKAFRFYDTWHSFLKERCGIDFIKVDGQSAVSLFYAGAESYGKASGAVQKGLGASAALHFHNGLISCMGMAAEDMWHRPSCAVSRSSDDFVPDVPHGFREHALQNSYNSLLQGQFYWGDWDMFWSSHEESRQNSMLRAVSGGPVYVSDAVGKTDGRQISPLILSDGRLLRCDGVGMPTVDCLFRDAVNTEGPLKIFNTKKDAYVVAALNIDGKDRPCQGSLSAADIPGLKGKRWMVWAYQEERLYRLNAEESIAFSLPANDGELFLAVPEQEDILLFGLLNKYVSTACVEYVQKTDGKLTALLKEGGRIGFWCGTDAPRVSCQGEEVAAEKKGGLWIAEYACRQPVLVEIRY